jgi:uncharacterized membrane protein YtjA (UPF0391 family)
MIFLRWLLIFMLVALGSVIMYLAGFIDKINAADVTKLSFVIYVVFMVFTLRVGSDAWRLYKMGDASAKTMLNKQESAWFVSDMLLTIGMIGTVLGFIYMLGTSFGEIRMDDVETVRSALIRMGAGMSTALYTTAAGLICSMILKLQLFLIGQEIDNVLASR